ncbi:hypothetical protein EMCG_01917 [[Emmonsia] crescens]|uniref:Uncharacterized protein n=1 Tax=[Emmonsia] crescens TaxID=73230 RepID=A0A0G2I0B2_9EURO|nr:hypothetical protein EMCG_01917 [Emmonsia crescens UAMH 3008]
MVNYFYKLDYANETVEYSMENDGAVQAVVDNDDVEGHDAVDTPEVLNEINEENLYQLNPDKAALIHTEMYAIGDKYMISGLKCLAKEKFETSFAKDWSDSMFYCIPVLLRATAYRDIAILETQTEFQEVLETLTSFSLGLLRKMIVEKRTQDKELTPTGIRQTTVPLSRSFAFQSSAFQ